MGRITTTTITTTTTTTTTPTVKSAMLRIETQYMFLCFVLLLYSTDQITGVHIREIQVPAVALEGDPVHLGCDYEDETGSSLYTLKWYKDQQEFYRHQPGISPHTTNDRCLDDHTYAVQGINVDCWVSTEREVVLRDVTRRTSGVYQCEVIGEHPNFRKEKKQSTLHVYSEPLQRPVIVGEQDSYGPTDYVTLNCSSFNVEYVPDLAWLINGHHANKNYLHHYDHRTLGLRFQARGDLFQRGTITVSCVSTIGVYHQESVDKELRSWNYLMAQEYQLNSGEENHFSMALLLFTILGTALLGLLRPFV